MMLALVFMERLRNSQEKSQIRHYKEKNHPNTVLPLLLWKLKRLRSRYPTKNWSDLEAKVLLHLHVGINV